MARPDPENGKKDFLFPDKGKKEKEKILKLKPVKQFQNNLIQIEQCFMMFHVC